VCNYRRRLSPQASKAAISQEVTLVARRIGMI
jgi:hypothetical protein